MKNKLYLLAVLMMVFVACRSTYTAYAPVTGYKYAVIDDSSDRGGDASLMNFKVQVQQALQEVGLEEISSKEIDKLSDDQKKKLLVLKLTGSQSHDNSVATINVSDYMTEKFLGSCNGVYGMSFSTYGDMDVAGKKCIKAFKQMIAR